MSKIYQDEDWLRQKYQEEKLSSGIIAEIAGCSKATIGVWLEKFGIQRRTTAEAAILRENRKNNKELLYRDKGWLQEQYIENELSMRQIAKLAECCKTTIQVRLEQYGIQRRTFAESTELDWRRGIHSTPKTRRKKSEALKKSWEGDEKRRQRARKWAKTAWEKGVFSAPSEEVRRKLSIAVKAAWARGDFADVFPSPSKPHLKIANELDRIGIEHRTEYKITGYNKIYDEYLPAANLLIEIDGVFWHHSEWAVRHGKDKIDAEKTAMAIKRGYQIVRITDKEIERRGAAIIIQEDILPLMGMGENCSDPCRELVRKGLKQLRLGL